MNTHTPEQLAAAKTVVAAIKSSGEYLKALKTLNDLDQTRHLCYTAARILAAEIERLEAAIKTHHDAIDAQPRASDEPVGVLLNKVTARLTQAEARVKELESENAKLRTKIEIERTARKDMDRVATEWALRAEKAEAENAKLSEHCRNQAERIRYLEGATNHATGTPLSAAETRVKELESQLSLAQHHASGRWGEYDRALVRVRALAAENAKLREENKLLAGYFEDALTLCEDAQIATNITAKMRTMLREALAQKGGAS